MQILNSHFVSNNGTDLLLEETSVVFKQNNTFYDNWATYGAAIHICDVSLLFLLNGSTILFINNTASVAGGAIYAGDRCLEATPQCFYQPFVKTANIDQLENMVNLTFINNTAGLAGEAIYGGSVDNCFTYNKFSGSHHDITFSQVYKKIFHVTPYSPSNVTSDPYGICFCKTSVSTLKIDCTNRQQTLKDKFPGEAFNISVVAVGQTYGVVPALIGITSQSTNISVARYQDPPLPKVCQIVLVIVFSKPNSTGTFNVTVKEVNAVKEKSNYYHLKVLNIAVSLKDCPWIFKFYRQTNSCDCSEVLSFTTCKITLSIHKAQNVWIGCSPGIYNDSACSKVEFSSQCLLSRCRDSSNISFTMSNLSDQCVDEREGRLCGHCKSNYSLSLGPMTCVHSEENCSIYVTVLLIVAFILAGVLLVCFLAVFNFTVAEGTINGLLFYANCVYANQVSFDFGSTKMSFFRVFIAWLNLDLGFQVCFYSGMTAYQKAWLEFGFVLYLFLLGGVIVCLSRRSIRFTRLVGRNVVPVLATIVLIAYPKIIRNSLRVWHCPKHLKSTDNLSISVWLSDETVTCFTEKHLPLFIFSILLFAVAFLYTLCLFFIQCLQRGTGCFALKWINKLRPFFDASSGPCRDHHRFWPGFLLFARLTLFAVIPFMSLKQLFWLIGLCVLVFFLAFFSPKGVYRKWHLNLLEFWFIFNLALTSTLILSRPEHKGIFAGIPIALAAVTFLLIFVYHTYKRVRGLRCGRRLVAVCRKKLGGVLTDNEQNKASFEVANERELLLHPE